MLIYGKETKLVRAALDLMLQEIRNRINTCPDTAYYAKELSLMGDEMHRVRKLLLRVETAIAKEADNEYDRT